MLLIGSRAVAQHIDIGRDPKDWDFIASREELEEDVEEGVLFYRKDNCDYLIKDDSEVLSWIFHSDKAHAVAELSDLWILYDAHRYFYRGLYQKSFKHICTLNRIEEIYKPQYLQHIMSERYRKELLNYFKDDRLTTHPNLNKAKAEFFNDKVTYYYDHDSIHKAVAFGKEPEYVSTLKGEVMFDLHLWRAKTFEAKVKQVLEEAFVLALERCLIPISKGDFYVPAFTPLEAFKYGLVRVATNITSGAFREFANYNFLKIYEAGKEVNYLQKMVDNSEMLIKVEGGNKVNG